MSDEEIIKRVRAGQFDEFGTLVERYAGLVWGLTASYVRNREDCADVAQEVLVLAYRRLDTLRDPEAFGAWLSQLARRHCLTWLRSQSRRRIAQDRVQVHREHDSSAFAPSPEELLMTEERYAFIRSAVASLPQKYREALHLYYMQDYSANEAAAFLGIKPAALRKRLQVARERLKSQWDNDLEEALRSDQQHKDFSARVIAALPIGTAGWETKLTPRTKTAGPKTRAPWSGYVPVVLGLGAAAILILISGAGIFSTLLPELQSRSLLRDDREPDPNVWVDDTAGSRTIATPDDSIDDAVDAAPISAPRITPESPPNGRAAGVAYLDRNVPFPGAIIEISQPNGLPPGAPRFVTADADGRFEIKGLKNESIQLRIEGEVGVRRPAAAQVQPGAIDIALIAQEYGVVHGSVIGELDGLPVPAFSARAVHPGYIAYSEGEPFSDGKFTLECAVGRTSIEIRAPGFALAHSAPMTVRAGESNKTTITMAPEARVQGVVLDRRTRMPIAEAFVVVTGNRNLLDTARHQPEILKAYGSHIGAITDNRGRFEVSQLAAGDLHAVAGHANFGYASVSLERLQPGETRKSIELVLDGTGSIYGTVTLNSMPMSGVQIYYASGEGVTKSPEGLVTDENGHYRISSVPPGQATLRAYIDVGSTRHGKHESATLSPGSEVRVDLAVETGSCTLEGTVYLYGVPAENAHLYLLPEDTARNHQAQERILARSGAGGRFQFTGLTKGEYRLTAEPSSDNPENSDSTNLLVRVRTETEPLSVHIGSAEPSTLMGRVMENGEPAQGLKLTVQKAKRDEEYFNRVAWTNSDGHYTLENLPQEPLEVSVAHPSLASRNRPRRVLVLKPGELRNEDFDVFTGTGQIDVDVLVDGNPVESDYLTSLQLVPVSRPEQVPLWGKAQPVMKGIPPGVYVAGFAMEYQGRSYQDSARVEVVDGATTDVVFSFESEGISVDGHIPGPPDLRENEGVSVMLFATGTAPSFTGMPREIDTAIDLTGKRHETKPDVNGYFRFEGIQEGNYECVAVWYRDGLYEDSWSTPLVVQGEETDTISISFQ